MEYGGDSPQYDEEGYAGDWEDEPPTAAHELVDAPGAAPSSEMLVLSSRVQAIVDAAEQSAEELRAHAEQRAAERIAEADRAAGYRVQAAEEEAAEIIAEANAAVQSIHDAAHAALREAEETLAQAKLDAEKAAKETVNIAREQAREIVRSAHLTTRDVLEDGTELSEHLRELSASLRNNAERLLRDIRLAHGSMTARLDQALPEGESAGRARAAGRARDEEVRVRRRTRPPESDPAVDFEVPDFIVGEE